MSLNVQELRRFRVIVPRLVEEIEELRDHLAETEAKLDEVEVQRHETVLQAQAISSRRCVSCNNHVKYE